MYPISSDKMSDQMDFWRIWNKLTLNMCYYTNNDNISMIFLQNSVFKYVFSIFT